MSENVFEKGPVYKVYFKMAIPVVMGLVISIVYNLTDTYFISQTNNTNLIAGVSVCAPIFTLLMAFGNIFGQGGSSLISRLLGKNDIDNLHRVSSFCFYVAIAFGVVSGFIMLALKTPIVHLLGADDEVFPYAVSYYTWFSIGAPFVVLSFIHSNLMRAEGMSTHSMISTVGGSVLNIILDPILIFKFNLGASGAAIATVLGYIFTDIYGLIIVFYKSKALSVNPNKVRLDSESVGQIFGIGISAALTNITSSICMILTNHQLLDFGNDKIAIMGIVQKVSMIVMLVIVGFSFGGAPLVGYYYGSQNQKRLRDLLLFVLKFLGSLSVGMSLIMVIFASQAMSFFFEEEIMITEGALMLRAQVITMVLMAVVLFGTIIFQATGKSIPALVLSLSRQGVVYVIVLFVMAKILGYNGIIFSQAVSDLISAIIAVVLLKYIFARELLSKA